MCYASQMVPRSMIAGLSPGGHDAGEWRGLSNHLLGFPPRRQRGLHRVEENLGREDVDSTPGLLLWPQVWSFWEMTQRDDRSFRIDA